MAPRLKYAGTLPEDLCFIRRIPFGLNEVIWEFQSEADLVKRHATIYTLMFNLSDRRWDACVGRMRLSLPLSPTDVDALRLLLPPSEVAFATSKSLGIGQ